jgi:hypothetical protein
MFYRQNASECQSRITPDSTLESNFLNKQKKKKSGTQFIGIACLYSYHIASCILSPIHFPLIKCNIPNGVQKGGKTPLKLPLPPPPPSVNPPYANFGSVLLE